MLCSSLVTLTEAVALSTKAMAPQLLDIGMELSNLLLVILLNVAAGIVKSYKLITQSLTKY